MTSQSMKELKAIISFSSLVEKINFLVAIIGICLLFAILFTDQWFLNLFSHFYNYYFLLSLILCVTCLCFRFYKRFFILITYSLVSGIFVFSNLTHLNGETPKNKKRKVYFQNINSSNKNFNEIGKAINQTDADLIGLIETSPIQEQNFDIFFQSYKEKINLSRDDNFGFSVYSKYPIKVIEIGYFDEIPIFVVFDVETLGSKFILVHLPPPIWKEAWEAQSKAFIQLEKYWISSQKIILMGDFNMTPWSSHYNSFFKKISPKFYSSNLNFQGSWPSFLPMFLQIPIDHVFSKQPIELAKMPALGSDHIGFLVNY